MTKQEADARRREVGNKDLEMFDAAIASHEALYRNLWTIRTMLKELGNLEQHHRGLKEAIAVVERQCEQINGELEAAKTRLTTVQKQEGDARQRVAELTAAAAEKERELSAYSAAIDKIVGKAA